MGKCSGCNFYPQELAFLNHNLVAYNTNFVQKINYFFVFRIKMLKYSSFEVSCRDFS